MRVAAAEHGGVDQRWMTSVSPSSMTMPTASSWMEHYFPNYASAPHTPFSPPSHGTWREEEVKLGYIIARSKA